MNCLQLDGDIELPATAKQKEQRKRSPTSQCLASAHARGQADWSRVALRIAHFWQNWQFARAIQNTAVYMYCGSVAAQSQHRQRSERERWWHEKKQEEEERCWMVTMMMIHQILMLVLAGMAASWHAGRERCKPSGVGKSSAQAQQ